MIILSCCDVVCAAIYAVYKFFIHSCKAFPHTLDDDDDSNGYLVKNWEDGIFLIFHLVATFAFLHYTLGNAYLLLISVKGNKKILLKKLLQKQLKVNYCFLESVKIGLFLFYNALTLCETCETKTLLAGYVVNSREIQFCPVSNSHVPYEELNS